MAQVYLDTSALAKRYVKEEGTEILDLAFEKASSEHPLVFSFWNIGERASMTSTGNGRRLQGSS